LRSDQAERACLPPSSHLQYRTLIMLKTASRTVDDDACMSTSKCRSSKSRVRPEHRRVDRDFASLVSWRASSQLTPPYPDRYDI
jgi:hypothetical protein